MSVWREGQNGQQKHSDKSATSLPAFWVVDESSKIRRQQRAHYVSEKEVVGGQACGLTHTHTGGSGVDGLNDVWGMVTEIEPIIRIMITISAYSARTGSNSGLPWYGGAMVSTTFCRNPGAVVAWRERKREEEQGRKIRCGVCFLCSRTHSRAKRGNRMKLQHKTGHQQHPHPDPHTHIRYRLHCWPASGKNNRR